MDVIVSCLSDAVIYSRYVYYVAMAMVLYKDMLIIFIPVAASVRDLRDMTQTHSNGMI